MDARTLYGRKRATHCHSAKDYVTRDLFELLMADEEHHIDFLETQLDLVTKLGLELYAQHHIGEWARTAQNDCAGTLPLSQLPDALAYRRR